MKLFSARLGLGLLIVLLVLSGRALWAQTAQLSGIIKDKSDAVIPNAKITLVNEDKGIEREVTSNDQGIYTIPFLLPGKYKLTVQAPGFNPFTRSGLVLSVEQAARLDLTLEVGNLAQSVTVNEEAPLISESPALSTVVNPQFVDNLPLNGRSFTALLALVPGVVPSSDPRMINVNGQRGTSNTVSIDGVSGNIGGALVPAGVGEYNAGTLMGMAATGTTQATANMDELQEFTVQTTGYGAEYGRQSGGQISFVTKSGTNQFHGSLFEYFRNEKLDANDWFSNASGRPRTALRQNNLGGTIGGPIIRDKTFFFFALEFDPLKQPAVQTTTVPTQAYRNAADPALKPVLDMFPLPNGTIAANGMSGIYTINESKPTFTDALSLKLDQKLGNRVSLFARYHRAPSRVQTPSLSYYDTLYTKTQTGTLGATMTMTPRIVNEFHFNWSRSSSGRHLVFHSMGGSVQPPDSALFPPGLNQNNAAVLTTINDPAGGVPSSSITFEGQNSRTVQTQWQFTDNLSFLRGKHRFDVGVDWRRISPAIQQANDSLFFYITNAAANQVQISANGFSSGAYSITETSLYAEDTWRASSRLTLNLGLRWELQPPPTQVSGPPLFAARNFDPNSPAVLTLAPNGTPAWKTQYANFAPRFGAAYHLFSGPGRDTVLHGAFGIYYDSDIGTPLSYLTNFLTGSTVTGTYPGVLSSPALQPPPFHVDPPYNVLQVSDPNLKTPYTMSWNFGVQQSLGQDQSLSLNYVGNRGKRLLMAVSQAASGNPLMTPTGSITQTTNQARSWYDALQVQFNRRLSHGLEALVNYTWSHSIDLASNNYGTALPGGVFAVNVNKASSDFDVRHMVTAALSYSIPAPFANRFLRDVAEGWSIDPLLRAYTAKPINLVYLYAPNFTYTYNLYPDLVPGQQVWISDPTVGGGRRINPAAFSIPAVTNPSQLRQGNAGRNSVRGFPAWQADFALRREFKVGERFKVQFSGEIFNIFNHPNFAPPYGYLGRYAFGSFSPFPSTFFLQSAQMLSQQGGSFGLGSNTLPVFAFGGQRDVQMALKVTF